MTSLKQVTASLSSTVQRTNAIATIAKYSTYGCVPEVLKHAELIREHCDRVKKLMEKASNPNTEDKHKLLLFQFALKSVVEVDESSKKIDRLLPRPDLVAQKLIAQA